MHGSFCYPGDHFITCLFDVDLMFNIDPGQEYPAVVEFAPFQKISKKKLKKKDAKAGSIEEGTGLPYLKIHRVNVHFPMQNEYIDIL